MPGSEQDHDSKLDQSMADELNNSTLKPQHEAQPSLTFQPDDIRSILLAERVEGIYRKHRENKPIKGKEAEFYTFRKMSLVRSAAKLILLFQIIFTKPQWCKARGQDLDEDCRNDSSGKDYYRSQLPVFDTGMDTYITTACLLFLSLSRLYRLKLNKASQDAIPVAVSCLILTILYITFAILHSFGTFTEWNFQDIISMVFILLYSDSIRRAAVRMIRIGIESAEVLIIFASVLLAFGCLARILFFGILFANLRF